MVALTVSRAHTEVKEAMVPVLDMALPLAATATTTWVACPMVLTATVLSMTVDAPTSATLTVQRQTQPSASARRARRNKINLAPASPAASWATCIMTPPLPTLLPA